MKIQQKNNTISYTKKIRNSFVKIIIPLKKYIFNDGYELVIFVILFGLIAYDIFISSTNSDIKFYGITLLYFITALFYRLKSSITFTVCLVLLILMFVFFILSGPAGPSVQTEKIAVWLFLFMLVGIIQQWK